MKTKKLIKIEEWLLQLAKDTNYIENTIEEMKESMDKTSRFMKIISQPKGKK